MSEARNVTREEIREALRGYCKPGVKVCNAELYKLLALTCEEEKNRLRTTLNKMVINGELMRSERGLYEYNFKFRVRKNTTFPKVWRFIRMTKDAWTLADACQLTGVSYRQVLRYCSWLENEDYIVQYGKKGTSNTYRATEKAENTPETPYPDITDSNPFERECAAAADIARLMLCHDPYQPTTARKVVSACNVLLARFGKSVTQLENEGETV